MARASTINKPFEFRWFRVHNVANSREERLFVTATRSAMNLAEGQRLLILMYHHIAAPPANARLRGLYTTPQQFDGHLRWLKKQPLEFTTFKQLKNGEQPQSKRLLILTFDDGLHDNYTEALPILRRHHVPAVVYPVMNDIGKRGVVWEEAKDQTPADLVNEDEIREMQESSVEFGSHLLDHTHLTRHSEESQNRQLTGSRSRLQEILSEEVLSIAYPYGDVDSKAAERAATAGYCFGLTTEEGTNTREADPMRLKRLPAKGSKLYHPSKFRRQVKRHLEI